MSTSKIFIKVDSSDYITAKRRMTIARENLNKPIPNIKNDNYKFIPTTRGAVEALDASNCLVQAKSFDLLQDYNVGTEYVKQQCM
jgi:hypothetical protein